MDLVVLTPEAIVAGETSIVNRLFENGMPRLHIRKYGMTEAALRTYIKAIDTAYHSRIVLHQHFRLVAEFGLAGIHINSSVRSQPVFKALVAAFQESHISTSFHSWQEIRENSVPYHYVFISPVFNSISKPGYQAAIELEELSEVQHYIRTSVQGAPAIYGLGGVGAAQIPTLRNAGFDGAAVLGSIWNSRKSVEVLLELLLATV
jgi:thiamine-phosphate pyrophosphorylase